jgi:hypothetical protein
VKGERVNTRTEIALLAHAAYGSNISRENVARVNKAYEDMLLEVDIDKPGRYSQELVRLAKAGKRSLEDQIRLFEEGETPKSEEPDASQDRAETPQNSSANDDPVAEADGNGADHHHADAGFGGVSRVAGVEEPVSAEEEVRRRAE